MVTEQASKDVVTLQGGTTEAQQEHTSTDSGKICQVTSTQRCYRCKGTHNFQTCKAATCHNCGKRGHIKSACRSRDKPDKSSSNIRLRGKDIDSTSTRFRKPTIAMEITVTLTKMMENMEPPTRLAIRYWA